MIRLAEEKDIPELKALWRDVFQEEEAYLEAFFVKIFKGDNALLYEEDGRIAAALHMVPYSMVVDEVEHPLLYLYAIGTLPEYRGKGYAGDITREALRLAEDRGYSAAFLVPAEESLFLWYERMGFETVFYKTTIRLEINDYLSLPSLDSEGTWKAAKTSNTQELWDLYRRGPYYQDNWVRLTREQNDFFLEALFRTGGEAWMLEWRGRKHYSLFQKEGDSLVVYETTIGREELPFFLSLARDEAGVRSVIIHQPSSFLETEIQDDSVPFAMIFQFKEIPLSKPGINRVLM
jgi:predicted acetyltransferase